MVIPLSPVSALSFRAGRSRELQIALEILSAASAIALEDQERVGGPYTAFKDDDSPITEADREIERMIVDRLRTFFPEAQFYGEEYGGAGPDQSFAGDVWVIDPIDGTTNYALGLSAFAISIGLVRDLKPVLGAVALPRLGEVYHCDFSGPARMHHIEMEVAREFERHQFLCVPSSFLKHYRFDFAGNIRGFGSTVYHCLLVARGVSAGAVVTPFLWDVAGALPMLHRAGAEVFSFETGEPLDLERWRKGGFRPFPMIACSPQNFERLRGAIQIHPAVRDQV